MLKFMGHANPGAQIHCVFGPEKQSDLLPDTLRETISMYLIGIGHNPSLPILCARATAHRVHLLIAVPHDVTPAQAMLLLHGEFLTLSAQTPMRFRLAAQSRPFAPKSIQSQPSSRKPPVRAELSPDQAEQLKQNGEYSQLRASIRRQA